jgi:hydrogenase maturation protease
MLKNRNVVILGIGCTLLADQGFGVGVVQALDDAYEFSSSVQIVDGGLIGVALTGIIADADHLIVVDVIRNKGAVGDFYRFSGAQILERLTARNSVPQVEFLEALAHCQALDDPPEAILLGVEPEDTDTLACELTPALSGKMSAMMDRVLEELDRVGVRYWKKRKQHACV